MRVLVVTNMYPTVESPSFGSFVYDQVVALREVGASVDVLFINGRASTWNYVWAFPRLWLRLLRGRYDVVHAHYILAGLVARAQWGHRLVLTHHGVEVLGIPRWHGWLCRLATPLFDQVIYTGEHLRRALDDADGWVIPCGIDLEQFSPRPRLESRARLGLPTNERLVLWAGEHRRPEKRYELAEQAMQQVRRTLPDARLVLVSDQPHSVIPAYMNACDALVLTSVGEGSPMVIKEAMACNLPIVSLRVGDVADIVGDTHGCAFADDDPADLARQLVLVLGEPRRTDGRARVQHLSHRRIAQRLLDVYARAVEPRAKLRGTREPHGA